jgi:hypothetical protein
MLDFMPIALLQHRFVRAQIALLGEAGVPTRLHWLEWVVIGLGGAFWSLVTFETAVPASGYPVLPEVRTWFVSCIALVIAALVIFAVTSRRAIAQGRAMYADPSPDRIAPYT